MALQKTFEQNGVIVNDGYLRVSNISFIGKTKTSFVLQKCANKNSLPIGYETHTFDYGLDGVNIYAQAYCFFEVLAGVFGGGRCMS